jgi:hypothetical protein
VSTRQGISLFVLGAIHLVFLLTLILEPSINVGVKAVVFASLALLIIGYARAPRTEAIHPKIETLLYPFIIALAGVLTYSVSIDLHFGPVIASAGIGFIASYLTLFKSSFLKTLPVPIYCGTFVGMCSSFHAEDYFFVAYAGLVAGVIYILTRDALNGIGGKLGTIAFGGVVVVSFIFSQL